VWSGDDEEWHTLATRTLALSGGAAKASFSWKPVSGNRKVRVKFLGSATNVASKSRSFTIRVKK